MTDEQIVILVVIAAVIGPLFVAIVLWVKAGARLPASIWGLAPNEGAVKLAGSKSSRGLEPPVS